MGRLDKLIRKLERRAGRTADGTSNVLTDILPDKLGLDDDVEKIRDEAKGEIKELAEKALTIGKLADERYNSLKSQTAEEIGELRQQKLKMNGELKNALDMNGDMLAAMKSREVARKLESDRLLAKMHELQEQREKDSKLKEEALEKLKDLEHRVDNIKTDINEPPKKKKKSIKVKNESKKAPPIPGVWKR